MGETIVTLEDRKKALTKGLGHIIIHEQMENLRISILTAPRDQREELLKVVAEALSDHTPLHNSQFTRGSNASHLMAELAVRTEGNFKIVSKRLLRDSDGAEKRSMLEAEIRKDVAETQKLATRMYVQYLSSVDENEQNKLVGVLKFASRQNTAHESVDTAAVSIMKFNVSSIISNASLFRNGNGGPGPGTDAV